MSQQDQIAPGSVVTIRYTLTGKDGKVLDESGAEGMDYLHGADNIVPGLEKQLVGRAVGDKLNAVVSPDEGYGERKGSPQKVPRKSFPDDVEIDRNHPLAGMTLTFDVEILAIRSATKDELAHGHPHGLGGHHHH